MKMMIVVLGDEDVEDVLPALLESSYRVTRIASTGGFFRRGNTTLLIGTEDDKVGPALDVVREHTLEPEDPSHRRATIFVLDVAEFRRI